MRYTLLVCFALSACATNSINNPKDFASYDDERLCSSAKWVFATHNNEGVIDPYLRETNKRKLMDEAHLKEVHTRKAGIGDNECFMFATWGSPYMRNSTSIPGENYYQYVYRRWAGNFTYVYTTNNVITAIQN